MTRSETMQLSRSAVLKQAVHFHRQGRFAEAVALYQRVLIDAPGDPEALNNLGALYVSLGKLDAAVAAFREVLRHHPNQVETVDNLAAVLLKLGQATAAAETYTKVAALRPTRPESWVHLGMARLADGDIGKAEAAFAKALSVDPACAEAHQNVAAMRLASGDATEAAVHFERAISLKPGLAGAHHGLGDARRRLAQLDDAAAAYRHALEITPNNVASLSNLGDVLARLGQTDEALAVFRRVVALDPNDATARHSVAALSGETTETAPRAFVVDLFDGFAERFDRHLVEDLGYRVPVLIGDLLRRQLVARDAPADFRFRRLLDLGCGTGLVARQLEDLTMVRHGVDLSRRMLEQARATALYDMLAPGDVVEFLETDSAAYDLAVAADVFPYIGNLDPIIAAVRRRLTPDGMFVVSVEKADTGYVLRPTGRYAHGEDYLRAVASRAGFAVGSIDPITVRTDNGRGIPGLLIAFAAA